MSSEEIRFQLIKVLMDRGWAPEEIITEAKRLMFFIETGHTLSKTA